MTGPSRPFSIAASTSKVDVDNRFPLKLYYRTADNLLKQASIYREERNIVELYILLLRFSSLVGETIPEHQSYRGSSAKEKVDYKRKLGQVLTELEVLKPEVQKRVEQINKKFAVSFTSEGFASTDYEWPPVSKSSSLRNFNKGTVANNTRGLVSNGTRLHSSSLNDRTFNSPVSSVQLGDQLSNLSLSLPRPRDETLSRHSFLGPNGLHGRWNLPITQARVQYPTYVDASPIDIPSLDQSWDKPVSIVEDPMSLAALDSKVPMTAMDSKAGELNLWMESDAMAENIAPKGSLIRQPSPPPVAAPVQKLSSISESLDPVPPWSVADPRPGPAPSLEDELTQTKRPKYVHVSTQMMEEFLKLARLNTNKNLETCGVLAGSLKKGIFFVTTLIIPKQQATSDSCQTVNEEEIFDCQDKRSLFQLGWIHTHPTQSCFMSSVDLHTHYSYQVMLPEAIAIVMAPTDSSRKYGIFRLSDPGGVKVIQQCQSRGFHPHEQPPDGGPIYEHGSHVLMNPSLVVEVIDLR